MVNGRCYACLTALLLLSMRTGFATPSASNATELNNTNASSPNTDLSSTEGSNEEEEPSNELTTFVYYDDDNSQYTRCDVCSELASRRRFECRAERKESAMRSGGILDNPLSSDSLEECCNRCLEVPNSSCRSWWRERGYKQLCYLNENR